MARAMWNAQLDVAGTTVGVKLYAAVEDRGVHFRLLDRKDKLPVQQQLFDPRTGQPVPGDAIRKGVEVERGVFVVLSEEDLAATAPPESRTIECLRFVPRSAVDIAWYRRPYYLGPDPSELGNYFALVEALRESGRVGVARWTMRKQRHFGVLEAERDHLVLVALRSAAEVVAASSLALPPAGEVREAERKLAEQLVAALDAPFEPAALRDDYRERVEKLVAAKAKGESYRVDEPRAPYKVTDLAAALERSLAAAKKRRSAAA